jgi:starch-binding outer membrane protein SusE/F
MKNFKYIILLLIGVALFSACSDNKDNPEFIQEKAVAPVLKALQSTYTLKTADASNNFDTFAFTRAKWTDKYKLGTQYTVQASLTSNFGSPVTIGTATTDTTVTVTNSAINSILINAKINPGIATKMYFRVVANATSTSGNVESIDSLKSAVVVSTITPYSTEIVYPKIYVIGAFNSWTHSKDLNLYSFNNNTIYCGVVNIASRVFKITGVADWIDNLNWGTGSSSVTTSEANSVQLVAGGSSGNISNYSKSFYHFTFDTSTLVLTKDWGFNTLSVVFYPSSGTAETKNMAYDSSTQRFYADVILSNGSINIQADSSTTLSWGYGSDGILKSASSNNIPVTAGSYRVYVDLNNPSNMTYTLSTDDYGK